MSLYEQKLELYLQYYKEVVPSLKFTDSEIIEECNHYINSDDISWKNIFDEDELVGFLVIGKSGSTAAVESNYSIVEAYVVPEYRKLGHMTRTASQYIDSHEGVYSLVVSDNRPDVREFWNKLFANCGYVPVELTDRYQRIGPVSLLGYKKG